MAWNAVRISSQSHAGLEGVETDTTEVVGTVRTRGAIAVLLELAEEVEHRLVEVVFCEVEVVVRSDSWDELDDGAANERVPVVLVQENLVADDMESLVHELQKNRSSQSPPKPPRTRTKPTHSLALEDELAVAKEGAVNRFGGVELEAALSLLVDHGEGFVGRLGVLLEGHSETSGQSVGGCFADGELREETSTAFRVREETTITHFRITQRSPKVVEELGNVLVDGDEDGDDLGELANHEHGGVAALLDALP